MWDPALIAFGLGDMHHDLPRKWLTSGVFACALVAALVVTRFAIRRRSRQRSRRLRNRYRQPRCRAGHPGRCDPQRPSPSHLRGVNLATDSMADGQRAGTLIGGYAHVLRMRTENLWPTEPYEPSRSSALPYCTHGLSPSRGSLAVNPRVALYHPDPHVKYDVRLHR